MGSFREAGARLLCVAVAIAAPIPLLAQQSKVELSLQGGSLLPLEKNGLQDGTRDVVRRTSLLGGGRLTFWISDRVGIEAAGMFSPADVRQESAAGVFSRSSDLFIGSGKLALALTGAGSGVSVMVNGGPALIRYGKTVADPDASKSTLGGVAGLGIRLPIASNVGIRGDVEGFLYRVDFGLGRKTVQDIALSAGLVIRF